MQTDICFPQNNEKEFISIAEKLGISNLVLVYPYKKDISVYKQSINKLQLKTKIRLHFALIAENNNQYIAECGPGLTLTQNGRFIDADVKYINVKNIQKKLNL